MFGALIFFCRSFQISHARRAWVPPLWKYGAMLSGDEISDLGAIKGVAAVAAGSALQGPPECVVGKSRLTTNKA
jgi:hypothetical protein